MRPYSLVFNVSKQCACVLLVGISASEKATAGTVAGLCCISYLSNTEDTACYSRTYGCSNMVLMMMMGNGLPDSSAGYHRSACAVHKYSMIHGK